MSKDQSVARKINPMRLLDAGADLLSSAVKNTVKLPGRLTSFIGNKLDEASGPASDGNKMKLENLRVAVSVEGAGTTAAEIEHLHYIIALVDKKTGDAIHTVHRTFAACQQVVIFVRSMAPKLEVPVQPQPFTARTSIPLLIEERRKFFQAYANIAIANQTSSNLREVRDLIGYGEYLSAKEEGGEPVRANLKHVTNDSVATSSANNSFAGRPAREIEQALALAAQAKGRRRTVAEAQDVASPTEGGKGTPTEPSGAASPGSGASPAAVAAVEECFRVIDDGGAGYITLDDMPAFAAAIPTAKAQRVFAASVKKTDAFNQQKFVQMVERVSSEGEIAVMDWVARYRASKFQPLYEAIGNADSIGDFSAEEVRTLTYILRVSGIRLLTQKEIDEEASFLALPVSFDDFCDLMNLLLAVLPFDHLWRDLQQAAPGHGRLIHNMNKACATANKRSAQALKSKILELGGGARKSDVPAGKCLNCEAVEMRLRAMKIAGQELQQENDKLRSALEAQPTAEQSRMQQKAAAREAELLAEVAVLKAKVSELERAVTNHASSSSSSSSESSVDDDDAGQEPLEARCNLFLLNPLHLGSSADVPVVDLPGPVVFNLPDDFRPLGFVMDAFLCHAGGGAEYLAIRDGGGKRCCAWTVEGDVLHFPWTLQQHRLPSKKWVRLELRFHWPEQAFDFVSDGSCVFAKIPMRDEGVAEAATLDIFPRTDVLLCYANMNFFR
jgi:hypothetical protein